MFFDYFIAIGLSRVECLSISDAGLVVQTKLRKSLILRTLNRLVGFMTTEDSLMQLKWLFWDLISAIFPSYRQQAICPASFCSWHFFPSRPIYCLCWFYSPLSLLDFVHRRMVRVSHVADIH